MLTRLFESVDKEMPEFHLQANLVIFNAVLSSSEVSGDWCSAFRLLQDVQEKHLSKIVWQHLFMYFDILPKVCSLSQFDTSGIRHGGFEQHLHPSQCSVLPRWMCCLYVYAFKRLSLPLPLLYVSFCSISLFQTALEHQSGSIMKHIWHWTLYLYWHWNKSILYSTKVLQRLS